MCQLVKNFGKSFKGSAAAKAFIRPENKVKGQNVPIKALLIEKPDDFPIENLTEI